PERGNHLEGLRIRVLEPPLLEIHILCVAAVPATENLKRRTVCLAKHTRLTNGQDVVEQVFVIRSKSCRAAIRMNVIAESIAKFPNAFAVVQDLKRGCVRLLDDSAKIVAVVRILGVKPIEHLKGGDIGLGHSPTNLVDMLAVSGPDFVELLKG